MIEAALYDLLNESIRVEKLLTSDEVAEYFERTATFDNRFIRRANSYSFGTGPHGCLIYNCNQQITTAGGTGLISLVNLLQRGSCNFRHMPVTWHFAPNLELGSNAALSKFRRALKDLNPAIVCALDDQLSTDNKETAHFLLKKPLPQKHANLIRTIFEKSGIDLLHQKCDPVMGSGFNILKPAQNALMVEIPTHCQYFEVVLAADKLQPADSVYLLMAAALIALDSITTEKLIK